MPLVTDDFKLLENIFEDINATLSKKHISYKHFEFTYQVFEKYGMTQRQLTITDDKDAQVTNVSINSDECKDFGYHLRQLHLQMKERGDNWTEMKLEFANGKVTTKFSYNEIEPW